MKTVEILVSHICLNLVTDNKVYHEEGFCPNSLFWCAMPSSELFELSIQSNRVSLYLSCYISYLHKA